jgi:hypothetical protein
MRLRKLSPKTQTGYIRAVKRLACGWRIGNCHPKSIT